jgi:hypothetical protein
VNHGAAVDENEPGIRERGPSLPVFECHTGVRRRGRRIADRALKLDVGMGLGHRGKLSHQNSRRQSSRADLARART